ncbi:hypothetical protein COR50_00380 [Chitinophaga caeni]|uniref:GIY-YIG domain-containing protein n=1 Tax=Chitinophaga caeni TaxID=2029983 RepID=A0A291QP86_9BACT|nr:hypothetical protein COR50_00380 [Chitinophaga caeni]
MNWYVYVIVSLQDGTFYKGITHDFHHRLEEHNSKQFPESITMSACSTVTVPAVESCRW